MPTEAITNRIYRRGIHRNVLVDIAYRLSDRGDEKLSAKLLTVARQITSMTISESVPSSSVLRAMDLLMQEADIDYCLIGGMAINTYCSPRGTDDIDILVDVLPPTTLTSNKEFMRALGFYPKRSYTGTVLGLDHNSGFVECILANSRVRKYALGTAKKKNVLGLRVEVASPEALVALKVVAMADNPKRMVKDGQDIVALALATHPDLAYVKTLLSVKEKKILADTLALR